MGCLGAVGVIAVTSDTFKQAAYAQQTDEVFIVLITLDSDELTQPIRIASDPYENLPAEGPLVRGVISNGDTYIFVPIDMWLPKDDNTGVVSAKMSIENIDRRIVETARSVTKPVNVNIQCVLSDDVDRIELEFDGFKLSNITYDVNEVTGDLTLDYWGLEPFPSGRFIPADFPGLF